jgi:hypothetical protein
MLSRVRARRSTLTPFMPDWELAFWEFESQGPSHSNALVFPFQLSSRWSFYAA